MSTFSLPRLINGGGLSRNNVINSKFSSLDRFRNRKQKPLNINGLSSTIPNTSELEHLKKHPPINRNGSIYKNQFRGIKKEYLETQTNLIIHSMTVSVTPYL